MPETSLAALQKDYEDALLEMGEFGNKSEIHRATLRYYWDHMPKEKRVQAAVVHYQNGKASISKAAVLAGLPFFEMKTILQEEGVLRLGFGNIEKSKAAARKFSLA